MCSTRNEGQSAFNTPAPLQLFTAPSPLTSKELTSIEFTCQNRPRAFIQEIQTVRHDQHKVQVSSQVQKYQNTSARDLPFEDLPVRRRAVRNPGR
jgi:hypothetical protein